MADAVRIALAGYGYWGENLARNLSASGACDLRAIVERHPERAERAGAQHPATRVVGELDSALLASDVEAIVIATPASCHAEHALAAIEAGKHVLVEKPFALDLPSAEKVAAAARAAGVRVLVGHTFLFAPRFETLLGLARAGELGDIHYVSSQRLSLGRVRADCDVVWSLAPHDIAMVIQLLGLPEEVSARAGTRLHDRLADVAFITMSFASGAVAGIHVSWLDPLKVRRLAVVGTRQSALYDDVAADRPLTVVEASIARGGAPHSTDPREWNGSLGATTYPPVEDTEPLRREIDAFAGWIRGGPAPPTDLVHALDVTRVLVAIEASIAEGGAPARLPDCAPWDSSPPIPPH
jgi:predicted dehydrogenase